MSSTLHFPDKKTLNECLYKHPLLQHRYWVYKERGITGDVSDLAARQFANCKIVLSNGELPRVNLRNPAWTRLSDVVGQALVDCAKKESL